MNLKIGIVLIIAVVIGLLLLSGMLGKLIGLVISLALWGAAGHLAGKLLQGEGYGLLGNIGLGLAGGFVGSLLINLIGMTGLLKLPFFGTLLVGTLGAVVVVLASQFVSRDEPEE